jgi:hypothetical protein
LGDWVFVIIGTLNAKTKVQLHLLGRSDSTQVKIGQNGRLDRSRREGRDAKILSPENPRKLQKTLETLGFLANRKGRAGWRMDTNKQKSYSNLLEFGRTPSRWDRVWQEKTDFGPHSSP